MVRVERDIVIQQPPDVVFANLVEPAQRAKWAVSFDEAPPADGTPVGVGTRIQATRRASTSGSRYELEITQMEAPRRLVMRIARNGRQQGRVTFDLHPAGEDATRVREVAEVELQGLQRMMAPVVTANLERETEKELAALKRHAEAR